VDSLKLTVEPQRANVLKMVTEVLSTCHRNAMAKNIDLRREVGDNLPCVWADSHRVRQILTNLIDNAIKFTHPGGVITVSVARYEGEPGLMRFAVADTGCGISAEHCELVFDRLAQVKSGMESSREGLGLGLFIAKELVTQHGGCIWVESALGKGSTFIFTLPVFSVAGRCAHILTAENLSGGEVTLIALDVVANERAYEPNVLEEISRVVERCIHPAQDVMLPWMNGEGPVMTMFVIGCTGSAGAAAISRRIGMELKNLGNAARIHPSMTATTLKLSPGATVEKQGCQVTDWAELLIQEHLKGEEKVL
jgi:two-component sensor histidine kinase